MKLLFPLAILLIATTSLFGMDYTDYSELFHINQGQLVWKDTNRPITLADAENILAEIQTQYRHTNYVPMNIMPLALFLNAFIKTEKAKLEQLSSK